MAKDQITISQVKKVMKPVYEHVHQDGGEIKLIEITSDYILRVKLLKACKKCKLTKLLLKEGMLKIIQRQLPEIKDVEIINK